MIEQKRTYCISQIKAVIVLQVNAQQIDLDFHVTVGAWKESSGVVISFRIVNVNELLDWVYSGLPVVNIHGGRLMIIRRFLSAASVIAAEAIINGSGILLEIRERRYLSLSQMELNHQESRLSRP